MGEEEEGSRIYICMRGEKRRAKNNEGCEGETITVRRTRMRSASCKMMFRSTAHAIIVFNECRYLLFCLCVKEKGWSSVICVLNYDPFCLGGDVVLPPSSPHTINNQWKKTSFHFNA